jgi:heme-degrading monooxygenase HmoA
MTNPRDASAEETDRAALCITVFRSRIRAEHLGDYAPTAERMEHLAERMPGFVSIKTFAADDGERVSIVEFASCETSAAWREHVEHREAQRLGRERFYSEFRIQVCTCVREVSFSLEAEANAGARLESRTSSPARPDEK